MVDGGERIPCGVVMAFVFEMHGESGGYGRACHPGDDSERHVDPC